MCHRETWTTIHWNFRSLTKCPSPVAGFYIESFSLESSICLATLISETFIFWVELIIYFVVNLAASRLSCIQCADSACRASTQNHGHTGSMAGPMLGSVTSNFSDWLLAWQSTTLYIWTFPFQLLCTKKCAAWRLASPTWNASSQPSASAPPAQHGVHEYTLFLAQRN